MCTLASILNQLTSASSLRNYDERHIGMTSLRIQLLVTKQAVPLAVLNEEYLQVNPGHGARAIVLWLALESLLIHLSPFAAITENNGTVATVNATEESAALLQSLRTSSWSLH